jgi:hypothetical protein
MGLFVKLKGCIYLKGKKRTLMNGKRNGGGGAMSLLALITIQIVSKTCRHFWISFSSIYCRAM